MGPFFFWKPVPPRSIKALSHFTEGTMQELTFRQAEEKDAGLILYFIKQLAEYEHMSDEVVATEELLRE